MPRSALVRVFTFPLLLSARSTGRRLGIVICLATIMATILLDVSVVRGLGGVAQWARKADFVSVLTGAAILEQHAPARLYDEQAQMAAQAIVLRAVGLRGTVLLPYNHPPMEAMLVAGLQSLGGTPEFCLAFWTSLSLLAIAGALAVLTSQWRIASSRLLTAVAALSFFPLGTGVLLGQSSAFLLLGWSCCAVLLRRGHDGWAGAALCLAALKPQVVPVLLLALLVGRHYRTLAGFAIAGMASIVATGPALGWDWPIRYLASLVRFAQLPPGPSNPLLGQGWAGLFLKLFGDGVAATRATALAVVVSLLLVAWIWYPVEPGRPRNVAGGRDWERRWALTMIIAILVDPHVLPHDLALAIVPAVILAATGSLPFQRSNSWLWLGWLAGFVAELYRGPLPPVATLWLTASAVWLIWTLQRELPSTIAPGAASTSRMSRIISNEGPSM